MSLTFQNYLKHFQGDIFYYGNASHGFYELLVWLQENNPKESPNVIMPVYIPAKLYRYVLAAGYEPKFYDVSLECQFNPLEIYDLIDDQTQAVFAVHYFGIPSAMQDLKQLTQKKGVFLIEDCAHTINSRSKGMELGSIGDAALFSTRKMLQMPSGGFLVLNNKRWDFKPSYKKRVRSIFTACKMSRARLKYTYFDLTKGADPLNLAWIPSTGYIDFSEQQTVNVKEMSWLSQKYINSIDIDDIAAKRRQNYEYLLNHLLDVPVLEIVGPDNEDAQQCFRVGNRLYMDSGFTPYSFPILTPLGGRDGVQQALCRVGAGCGAGWPESPFNHKGYPQAMELSHRLLELPIHQGINKYQLRRMVDCLKKYMAISNKYSSRKTKISLTQ